MSSAICQQRVYGSAFLFGAARFESLPTVSNNFHPLPSREEDDRVLKCTPFPLWWEVPIGLFEFQAFLVLWSLYACGVSLQLVCTALYERGLTADPETKRNLGLQSIEVFLHWRHQGFRVQNSVGVVL